MLQWYQQIAESLQTLIRLPLAEEKTHPVPLAGWWLRPVCRTVTDTGRENIPDWDNCKGEVFPQSQQSPFASEPLELLHCCYCATEASAAMVSP